MTRLGFKQSPEHIQKRMEKVRAQTIEDTFWRHVEKTDYCWLWTGCCEHGYGRVKVGDGKRQAHRVAYELLVGPIPEYLTLDHLCRVRNCVNPAHLEPVTSAENILRGMSSPAQNARKTECLNGHAFTVENTLINVIGARVCRTCTRLNMRETRRAKREMALSV